MQKVSIVAVTSLALLAFAMLATSQQAHAQAVVKRAEPCIVYNGKHYKVIVASNEAKGTNGPVNCFNKVDALLEQGWGIMASTEHSSYGWVLHLAK